MPKITMLVLATIASLLLAASTRVQAAPTPSDCKPYTDFLGPKTCSDGSKLLSPPTCIDRGVVFQAMDIIDGWIKHAPPDYDVLDMDNPIFGDVQDVSIEWERLHPKKAAKKAVRHCMIPVSFKLKPEILKRPLPPNVPPLTPEEASRPLTIEIRYSVVGERVSDYCFTLEDKPCDKKLKRVIEER
jgi:hypothetical protein